MTARDKIKTAEELGDLCACARERGQRVVFTNGCFDLLHAGHVRYLEEARGLGDLLIVGVNSDDSVRSIKGPLRPIVSEDDRSELVAALQCVSFVVLFGTSDPLPLIELLRPHVLVKGADWAMDKIVGSELVLREGGNVARIPLTPRISTTIIIERIAVRFSVKCGAPP